MRGVEGHGGKSIRCLLAHYGSYDSFPPLITGRLLELEDVVQTEATRRRWRFLAHLPLSGAFRLCELALGELLPPEALAPFAEELAARDKRRRRQRADERRQAAAEAAAVARAAAARVGPTADELAAMPSLGQMASAGGGGELETEEASEPCGSNAGGRQRAASFGLGTELRVPLLGLLTSRHRCLFSSAPVPAAPPTPLPGLVAAAGAAATALAMEMQLTAAEVAESLALQASLEDAAAEAAGGGGGGGGGVSFAHITKMGYAATGPALGTSPPQYAYGTAAAAGPPPAGAWGARTAGGSIGPAAVAAPAAPSSPWGGGGGGSGAAAATNPAGTPGGSWGVAAAAAPGGAAGAPIGVWGSGKGAAAVKVGGLAAAVAAAPPSTGKSAAPAAGAGADPDATGGVSGGSAKKSKSGKGTLLFSTGNARKY
ncbi:RING finger protein 10 [Tetrabaena socialis]|uniref:RING finger protein 10 n=1 Tax=Tetrabaena socialis TaxID=47790 RepID=A0A2J8ADX8_9CHLO|nr:RING finger protein 10 [Tetrabaena socialis]|eukprot:PNH10725.1 RING finger protein 10 [Tetrabaena socialis]